MRPEFLSRLAEADRNESAPPEIKNTLRSALRARQQVVANARPEPGRLSWALLGAAAAIALIVAAAAFIRPSVDSRTQPDTVVKQPVRELPVSRGEVEIPLPETAVAKPELTPLVRRASRRSPVENRRFAPDSRQPETRGLEAREMVTQFYALTADATEPLPGAQLMRVRVPRSAMRSFGFPVDMDRAGGQVSADVIVGQDGVARAIRFVHGYTAY